MVLLIDIGNTNTVIGVHEAGRITHSWRIETRKHRTQDEYRVLLSGLLKDDGIAPTDVCDAIVSSVVPELNDAFRGLLERMCGREPLFVGPGVKTGMPILLDNPREVGADRIANGVAAHARCRGACVVLDFGTATTFDVVSARGEYLGGAISPGPLMSVEALGRLTSKLHVVEIKKPARAIGRSTTESMKSGIFFGYLAQIEGLLGRIANELGEAPHVFATGGLAGLFARETDAIHEVDETLTLEGLALILARNRK